MSIFALIASFGGGIIGAYMGALPAFIMTGIVAIVGSIVTMAGGADVTLGFIAFGSYLGPHIAFAGGVAAAAFAGKIKKLENGADICSSLAKLCSPMIYLVGGIFGVFGFLVHYLCGEVLHFNTDLPAIAVIVSAIVARLVFGSTGLISKYPEGKRNIVCTGCTLISDLILGGGIGAAIGFIYKAMEEMSVPDVVLSTFPLLCFGIAATTLIFAQTGFETPATHHIALPAALAVALSGNALFAIVFGALGAVLGSTFCNLFNTNSDSHIDPPAFTIFTLTFIVNMIFGSGFLSM